MKDLVLSQLRTKEVHLEVPTGRAPGPSFKKVIRYLTNTWSIRSKETSGLDYLTAGFCFLGFGSALAICRNFFSKRDLDSSQPMVRAAVLNILPCLVIPVLFT